MDSKPGERSICCTELKDDHVLLPLGFHLLPPRFVPSNFQPESILYAYRYSASCDIRWDRGYGFPSLLIKELTIVSIPLIPQHLTERPCRVRGRWTWFGGAGPSHWGEKSMVILYAVLFSPHHV